jgi:uncharacterized protein
LENRPEMPRHREGHVGTIPLPRERVRRLPLGVHTDATCLVKPMALTFQWDEDKAEANRKKHRVDFEEASSVFGDPLAKIFSDDEHSAGELREILIGHSVRGRLLLVSFTERGRNCVRIISSRVATRRERKAYEEAQAP